MLLAKNWRSFGKMEGTVNNFRRARHHQYTNQMIITLEGYDTKEESEKLIGKKVTWTSPAGKEIVGEVRALHGNGGAIRALFEKGLPGQAIGTKVKVE